MVEAAMSDTALQGAIKFLCSEGYPEKADELEAYVETLAVENERLKTELKSARDSNKLMADALAEEAIMQGDVDDGETPMGSTRWQ